MNIFEEKFLSPERQYAIYPIIHGRIAEEEGAPTLIADKLEAQGFAGVVGNIPYRNQKDYPNDKTEWDNTERGFRDYIGRGMKTWVYDEKGYPSGSAGGAVLERNPDHPEFQAVGLYCYEYWKTIEGPLQYRADVPGDKFEYAMLLPLDSDSEPIDVSGSINENGTLYMNVPKGSYHLFMMSSRRLFDGTHAAESYSEPRNYINLCDAEATKAFIDVTHEKYAERMSDEFGKGIRAFFTDEPSLIAWNIRTAVYPIVPWHRDFPADFEKAYGYPISKAVVAVVTKRGPEVIKRRCDFWDFVANKVADNYFGVIQNWCQEHGLASSGHMLEEEVLQAHINCYGSFYRCAKRMDWPGIDQLDSDPGALMKNTSIPIARFLASFADVYGSGEAFTEFSDHTERFWHKKQIGMNWIKGSVNWHNAMGINNMTSYYNFTNFTDDELRDLNTYTARIGYMMRHGKRMSKTALLYPEASMWAAYTPSAKERAVDNSEEIMLVQNTFTKASWELINRQIDFDYIDEQLIADGAINNGALEWNGRRYEAVVLPACNVLSITTVNKLVEMLNAGIGVVILGDLPKIARETGAEAGFYEMLSPYLKNENLTIVPLTSNWQLPSRYSMSALPRPIIVTENNPKAIVDGEVISELILTHTRILEDGNLLVFVCNMGGNIYEGQLSVEKGISAECFAPSNGSCTKVEMVSENGNGIIDLEIRPYESFIYYVKR